MPARNVVHIDEALCTGCGACITPCAEGALAMVDGKARVVSDALCDGAGFCLAVCPTGALSIERRDALGFDAAAAEARKERIEENYMEQVCFSCGASERDAVLFPCRRAGESLWVCARCLPRLIHGRG